MRTILKSDFFWQFIGGFVLGAIGLATLHPADTAAASTDPVAATAPAMR